MDLVTLALAKKYADKQIEKAELDDIELDKTLTKEGFAADAKAVGDAIANLDIGGNIEQVQVDWDQNDSSQIDYIKNRPFYESVSLIMNSDVCGFTRTFTNRDNWFLPYSSVDTREKYRVTFDGISYDVENQSTYGLTLGDNGFMEYPFYVSATDDMDVWNITVRASDMDFEHTIQVAAVEGEIKKLDAKFLPDNFGGVEIDTTLSIEGAAADAKAVGEAIASKEQLQADWNQTDITAADYIKNKPFGIDLISVVYNEEIRWYDGRSSMEESYWTPSSFSIPTEGYDLDSLVFLFEFNQSTALIKMGTEGEIEVGGAVINYYLRGNVARTYFFNFSYNYFPSNSRSSYMKISVVSVKQLPEMYVSLSPSDWNQFDESQNDYIKNRTHYDSAYSEKEVLGSYHKEDEMGDSIAFSSMEVNIPIESGYYYFIETEMATYEVQSFSEDDGMMGTNYCIIFNGQKYVNTIDTIVLPGSTFSLRISKAKLLYSLKQLDEKFIPDTIARVDDLEPNNVYVGAEEPTSGNIDVWFNPDGEIYENPEFPTTLPNPNALTITGVTTESYDGSAPVTINIPKSLVETAQIGQTIVVKAVDENGKPTEWEPSYLNGLQHIKTITLTEEVTSITVDTDEDGNPFNVQKLIFKFTAIGGTGNADYASYSFYPNPTYAGAIRCDVEDGVYPAGRIISSTGEIQMLGTATYFTRFCPINKNAKQQAGTQAGGKYTSIQSLTMYLSTEGYTFGVGTKLEVYGVSV